MHFVAYVSNFDIQLSGSLPGDTIMIHLDSDLNTIRCDSTNIGDFNVYWEDIWTTGGLLTC